MSVRNNILLLGFISLLVSPSVFAQEVRVTIGSRQNNTAGLTSEVEQWFNKADCEDNVEITFEVDVINVSNDFDLFLFVGSSCDSSVDGCTELGDIVRNTGASLTDAPIPVRLQDIFTSKTDCIDNTDSQSALNIWAGVMESPTQDSEDNTWSRPLKLTLDLFVPPAATDVEAQFGEETIRVSWDADNDDLTFSLDDVQQGEQDTDTDSDTDTEDDDDGLVSVNLEDGEFFVLYESCGVAVVPDTGDDTDPFPLDLGTDTDGGSDLVGTTTDCRELCEDVGFEAGDTDFAQYPFKEVGGGSRTTTLKDLTNGTAYKVAVVSLDAFANPSEISEWGCAIPGETTNFFEAYTEEGGDGAEHYCFVATAAFGSYDHPTVQVLRQFRDGFLTGLVGGEQLIDLYYAVGPQLAGLLDGRPQLAADTRGALRAFAPVAAGMTKMGPKPFNLSLLLLCCGSVVAMIVVRRRRRR